MKKMIALMIAGIAMVGLSGCNTTGTPSNNDWEGSGNQRGTTTQALDITELHNGFIVFGHDYNKGRDVEIDFCGREYAYYREGDTTQEGTFNIKKGERLERSRINFFMNDGHTSYRIDTEDDNDYGQIQVGHTYPIKFQNEEIHVETIATWSGC